MQYEIGKIIEFDNYKGEILSSNGKFIFLKNDLKLDKLNLGELVIFRPEVINGHKRAFYIQDLRNILKDHKKRDKVLKKINLLIE